MLANKGAEDLNPWRGLQLRKLLEGRVCQAARRGVANAAEVAAAVVVAAAAEVAEAPAAAAAVEAAAAAAC
jgi:hypothetical protein